MEPLDLICTAAASNACETHSLELDRRVHWTVVSIGPSCLLGIRQRMGGTGRLVGIMGQLMGPRLAAGWAGRFAVGIMGNLEWGPGLAAGQTEDCQGSEGTTHRARSMQSAQASAGAAPLHAGSRELRAA
jgi:hypothetical protein